MTIKHLSVDQLKFGKIELYKFVPPINGINVYDRVYMLLWDTKSNRYRVKLQENGIITQTAFFLIRNARIYCNNAVRRWKKETSPIQPETRIKVYKICLNASGTSKSQAYYRDVAQYKKLNPQYPKNALLYKSKHPADWLYEDTLTQV